MSKPTPEEVEKMRHELTMNEIDTIDMDEGSLYDLLRKGCTGYDNYSNEEIVKMHAEYLAQS